MAKVTVAKANPFVNHHYYDEIVETIVGRSKATEQGIIVDIDDFEYLVMMADLVTKLKIETAASK